jgi:CheY-like chemotaxis protein
MQFVGGGDAALHACANGSFDIVISDLIMPDMDGAVLLTRVCELYPTIERLILTGYSNVALAAFAIPTAGQTTLSKASDGTHLKDILERLFELQDSRLGKDTGATAATNDEPSALAMASAGYIDVARHDSGISISQMSGGKPHRIRQFLQAIIGTAIEKSSRLMLLSSIRVRVSVSLPSHAGDRSIRMRTSGRVRRVAGRDKQIGLEVTRPVRHVSSLNATNSDAFHSNSKYRTPEELTDKNRHLDRKEDFFGSRNYSSTLSCFTQRIENFGAREYSRKLGRFVSVEPAKLAQEVSRAPQ